MLCPPHGGGGCPYRQTEEVLVHLGYFYSIQAIAPGIVRSYISVKHSIMMYTVPSGTKRWFVINASLPLRIKGFLKFS